MVFPNIVTELMIFLPPVQGRNIVIFYGSQTGTAEEFAARLAKEANRFGLKAMVADPEECEMVSLKYSCIYTCLSYVINYVHLSYSGQIAYKVRAWVMWPCALPQSENHSQNYCTVLWKH